jgi:serine/threonine-protein kinase
MTVGKDDADLIGTVQAGQFLVERRLRGSAARTVYLAEQLGVGRRVVLELIPIALGDSRRAPLDERFQREAERLAQLEHPNVAQLHAFGRCDGGELYLATEHVEGRPLRHVLHTEGPWSEARVLGLIEQLCGALHAAQERGLVHREPSPDDVVLRDGTPDAIKVLDLGLYQLLGDTQKALTSSVDPFFGTPLYKAPEPPPARGVEPRANVRAVGRIAYELLTGVPVFAADGEVMARQSLAPTPGRGSLRLRASTERLIARCLEEAPQRRFADLLELSAAARAAAREPEGGALRAEAAPREEPAQPAAAEPVSAPEPKRRGAFGLRTILGGVVLGLLALGVRLYWPYESQQQIEVVVATLTPSLLPERGAAPEAPSTARESAPPAPSDESAELWALQRKYQAYASDCLARTRFDFLSRALYLETASAAGPVTGKKVRVNETSDGSACADSAGKLGAEGAPIALDGAAQRFASAARALHELTLAAHRYYAQGDYKTDGLARGRELHRPLVGAYAEYATAHAALKHDLDAAEQELDAWFSEHASAEEAARLEGDAAARSIARLGNVPWTDVQKVDAAALRVAIHTYEQVLAEQPGRPAAARTQLLDAAQELARRVARPEWSEAERSALAAGTSTSVKGSPLALLASYAEAPAFFEQLPLLEEIPVAWAPAPRP